MQPGSQDRAVWGEAKRIFALVLEQEPRNRPQYLRELCGSRPELLQEVSSLLEAETGLDSFFEHPPAGGMAGGLTGGVTGGMSGSGDPMIGRRVGSYRVLRRIGSGGMGVVYMAERADDQFRKRVALKAMRPGLIDEHALRRFQNERQTLAVLEHPNIIKLLDGGNTEDGVPYLVMEFIEGQPIDKYCAVRKLSLREKLALLRAVLGAVHYAHQNLIVHRDLKPGNILVTAEGVPKLLDFGIAKLLRPEYLAGSIGLTRTEMQPMTPEYASPEQVLGHPITTATDIYSLGVILYRLLTGCHPYELKTSSSFELERAICESEPEKPSRFAGRSQQPASLAEARMLRGDLDTIALKAISKEPQRRYASAEHFAEDLRRFLEGWPISARKAGAWYRTSKFVGRHRAGTAGAVLLAALLIFLGWTSIEEKRAAERRFGDLRRFANWTLTELDDKLREGPTPARMELTRQGLQALDSLERERSDPSVRRDLFNGYIKTGDVLGNLYRANLGETSQAEASYRQALRIAEDLLRRAPRDIDNQRCVVQAHIALGQVLAATGSRLEALQHYDEAFRVNTGVQEARPADQKTLLNMARIWRNIGSSRALLSDPEGALESYWHALETVGRLPASYRRKKYQIAFASEMVAYFSALCGDPAGSEETILKSIAAYKEIFDANPTPDVHRNLAKAWKSLAEVRSRAGKKAEALAAVRQSQRITEDLIKEDPKDQQLLIDRQQALFLEIRLLAAAGNIADQRTEVRRALAMMKALADQPDAPYQHATDYAELLATTQFPEFRDDVAALRYARQAALLTHETDPDVLHVLALAYKKNGDPPHAGDADRKALSLLPPVGPGRQPSELRKTLEGELAGLSDSSRP
jgi:serine/threonine protein kinase